MVESLQDRDIYYAKLKKFEEKQRIQEQIDEIKKNIKDIIVNKSSDSPKEDSTLIKSHKEEAKARSRSRINKPSNEYKDIIPSSSSKLFLWKSRSKSVQRLKYGKNYIYNNNKFLIKGIFGQPKEIKEKENSSKRDSLNKSKNSERENSENDNLAQNCVIKMPNEAILPEDSYGNMKDTMNLKQFDTSFMSSRNRSQVILERFNL